MWFCVVLFFKSIRRARLNMYTMNTLPVLTLSLCLWAVSTNAFYMAQPYHQSGIPYSHQRGIPFSHQSGIPFSHQTGVPFSHQTGIPFSHHLQPSPHHVYPTLPRHQQHAERPAGFFNEGGTLNSLTGILDPNPFGQLSGGARLLGIPRHPRQPGREPGFFNEGGVLNTMGATFNVLSPNPFLRLSGGLRLFGSGGFF